MGFEKLLFQKIDLSVSLIFTSIVMNYDEGTKKNLAWAESQQHRAEPSIFALWLGTGDILISVEVIRFALFL